MVCFYIIEFGRLLCPNFNKAWSLNEVAQHQGEDDYWVTIQGVVYDVSDFVFGDHSDILGEASNGRDTLSALAGQDLTQYFPVPLALGCAGLVEDSSMFLTLKNNTITQTLAVHKSGSQSITQSPALQQRDWYTTHFLKTMNEFKKGPLVYDTKVIQAWAADPDISKIWAVWDDVLYDLTDYFWTQSLAPTDPTVSFLNSDITDVFKQRAGQDITKPLNKVLEGLDETTVAQNT
ncbi:hypothetical protein C0992_013283, partial [Termitomyces sp. T32_za158]